MAIWEMKGAGEMKNIFVSSTFRDFQKERDVLNDRVLPELNMRAGRFGESVSFCDLRWGIDTTKDSEEAATRKILSVCMDEIDRSQPYMVILLGSRYGYIPGSAYILEELDKRSVAMEHLRDLEISITQFEIEYGLLSRPENKPHIFVYVRTIKGLDIPAEFTAESTIHEQKQAELLERIRQFAGSQVRPYEVDLTDGDPDDLGPFAEMVKADLLADLEKEWEKYRDISANEKEMLVQWNLLEEKKEKLKLHREFAAETEEKILAGEERFRALKGASGCGKSVLFSDLCAAARDRGWHVIPALCGSSVVSSDPSMLCDYLIWHLEAFLHRAHQTIALEGNATSLNEKSVHTRKMEYLDQLSKLVGAQETPVLIAVDALDQLYPHKMERHNDFLPRSVPKNMRVFVTAVQEFSLPGHYHTIHLEQIAPEMVAQAAEGIQRNYGKTIAQEARDALCRRPAAQNLLYLTMAVMRLNLMNRHDFQLIRSRGDGIAQINRRQMEIVEGLSEDSEKLAVQLLESVANMDSGAGILQALKYLAVSRTGLRMTDLETLLKEDGLEFVPLDFYVYIHALKEFFLIRPSGNVDFQHKTIRKGLLAELGDTKPIHEKLFAHLRGLPEVDPLRNEEIVYHAWCAGQRTFIPRHIASLRFNGYVRSMWRMGALKGKTVPGFYPELDYDYLCQQMASDLYGIILSDPIMDVAEMMTSLPPEKKEKDFSPIYWMEFVTRVLPLVFGETQREHMLQFVLLSCMKAYAEEVHKNFQTPQSKKSLAMCCRKLGVLAESNTGRDMTKEATAYIRDYSRLIGEILREDKQVHMQQYLEYAESREYLMSMLLRGETEAEFREVIALGKELLPLYEKLQAPERTARVWFNMGLAYERLGGPENRENAYQSYMKTVAVSEKYAQEKKDQVSLTYRILSTLKVGQMCLDVERFDFAQQVYLGAYRYAKEAEEQFHDLRSREFVLMAMEGIGMAWKGQGTEESRAQAKSILGSTMLQLLSLMREYANPGVEQMCQRLTEALKDL